MVARIKPVKQRRARTPNMEVSGGRRSKTNNNRHDKTTGKMIILGRTLSCSSLFVNPVSFPLTSFLDERERWFLWVPVFIGGGIAGYFSLATEPPLWLLGTAPLLFLAFLVSRHRFDIALPIAACLLACALGFNAAQIETRLISRPMLTKAMDPVSITGTLMRAEALPEGARLTLKKPSIQGIEKEDRPLLLRIKVKTPYAELPEAGSRVNLWGPLWPPNDSALPNGYDFRRQAFFKQIGGTGLSYVPPRTYEARYPPPFLWDGVAILFEKARNALILATFARLNGNERDMTAALLSGSQTSIDKDVMEDMRASGLSHLLSISGVHVSMMALLIYVPLRFFFALFPHFALRWPIKKIAAFIAIIATGLYTCLVGADAPTVRSALMTGLVFFAIMMDRRAMSLRLVALAACAIMLTTPSAMMGASFQMSFAAVLAMIAAYEKRIDLLVFSGLIPSESPWMKRAVFYLRDIVVTSLIATAATTPFTIFHFQTFSFYGVFANMLAIPLTTLWIQPCLLLIYLAAPLGLANIFIDGAGWGTAQLIALAQTVAQWPYSQIPFPPMPSWSFGTLLLGGLWLCLWKTAWRYIGLAAIIVGCLYPLFVTRPHIYISDDKPVWAVSLRDRRLAVYGKRKEDFTTGQWLQHHGTKDAVYLNRKSMEDAALEELSCDEEFCAYRPPVSSSAPLVIFLHNEATQATVDKACQKNDIILVSFEPLPNCSNPRAVISADRLEKQGSHTITFDKDTFKIISARPEEVHRPWRGSFNISEQAPPSDPEPLRGSQAKDASHIGHLPE